MEGEVNDKSPHCKRMIKKKKFTENKPKLVHIIENKHLLTQDIIPHHQPKC
jgi:glutathione synthase/RimK-type ligase-like ATP-grasp enzyme